VLDDALEELAACRAEPDTLALFDALHFLREALLAGADASAERQALVRVVHTHRDARGVAVLAALGHVLDDDDDEDPLAPLLAAASLSPQVPDPHRALEAWIVRQQRIVQVQQERLDHAGRLVAQARQSTQLAAATGVALLGVVVLLLLVEGDWLTVPVPDRSTQEDAAGPPAPQATGPGAR
jgi:hypothetical protein